MARERTEPAAAYDARGIRLLCDGVELKPPDDSDIEALADLAALPEGVLPEAQHHYLTWLDKSADRIKADLSTELHSQRNLPRTGHWTLNFAVFVDARIIGLQSLVGFDLWPHRRNVGTNSWLASSAQRNGYGTRARVCVLDLAFNVLSGQAAMSWVSPDNTPSRRLSERLGYTLVHRTASTTDECKYQLTAGAWKQSRPPWLPPTRFDEVDVLRAWLVPATA